jgi:hypothetical protein
LALPKVLVRKKVFHEFVAATNRKVVLRVEESKILSHQKQTTTISKNKENQGKSKGSSSKFQSTHHKRQGLNFLPSFPLTVPPFFFSPG